MENPFRYGEVVGKPYFVGRDREMAELRSDLRSGQNVLISAPRRIGKSSLVIEVLAGLREEGIPTAYLDLLRVIDFAHLPDALATAISGMMGRGERALTAAAKFLNGLPRRPKFGLDPTDMNVSVEFSPGTPADTLALIEGLLDVPARIAEQHTSRVILALDEIQAVEQLHPKLADVMRAIFQRQPDVAHVYLGSRRHIVDQMFNERGRPFFRSARPLVIRPIPRDVFAAFIAERFASTMSPISDEAVGRVLDLTACHPSDTQELCSFLWTGAQYSKRAFPIAPDAVDEALTRVLDANDARFRLLWEDLPPPQRALIAALASDPDGRPYAKEFRQRHRMGEPTTVQRAATSLVTAELLESTLARPATFRITEGFLAPWLKSRGITDP